MRAEKRQCAKSVWRNGEFRATPCEKNATFEHDGQWYCKTHHLPSKAAREKATPKCAYADKHYQCSTTVRDTKYCSFHECDRIGHDALVELRKDKARLDFLELRTSIEDGRKVFIEDCGGWVTISRETIDAAMEATNAK